MENISFSCRIIPANYKDIDNNINNGYQYAKYLRREKRYKNPIVVYGTKSEKEAKENTDWNIMTFRGHEYVQIKDGEDPEIVCKKVAEKLESLDDMELYDCVLNYCSLSSFFSFEYHSFKGQFDRVVSNPILSESEKLEKIKEISNKFFKKIKEVYRDFPRIIKEFEKNIFEVVNTATTLTEEIKNITEIKQEFFTRFINQEEDVEVIEPEYPNWKVLFLEDQIEEIQPLLMALDEVKVKYSVFKTFNEAKKEIEYDNVNQYSVIVSDYTLLDSEEDRKEPQGYTFLKWASTLNRHYVLMSLSGMFSGFKDEIKRIYGFKIEEGKKSKVGETLQKIVRLGDENYEALSSIPVASEWKNVKEFYIHHRNDKNYEKNEAEINKIAENVARELEVNIDQSGELTFSSSSHWVGNTQTGFKGKNYFNLKHFESFKKFLIQRRVFYILFLKCCSKEVAIKLIQNGNINDEMSNADIKACLNKLCITDQDIPHNLLVEEKFFLERIVNFPLFKIEEMLDQSFSIINGYLSARLNEDNRILNLFKDIEGNENNEEGTKNYVIYKEQDKKYYFATTSLADCRILFEKIYYFLSSKEEFEFLKSIINDVLKLLGQIEVKRAKSYKDAYILLDKLRNSIQNKETINLESFDKLVGKHVNYNPFEVLKNSLLALHEKITNRLTDETR